MTKALPQPLSQNEEKRLAQIAYLKEYRIRNAAIIAEKAKAKYLGNRDAILAQKREYAARTADARAEYRENYYKENREKIIEKAAKLRALKREELARWQREYRQKNQELMWERDRKYYQQHRERNLRSKSEWGKTEVGRLKQRAKNQIRRARKNSVPHNLKVSDIVCLKALSKGRCFYCGNKRKLTIDHIIPISKGGGHTRDNVVMACKSCNSSKNAKDPIRFARERGMLLI
jgi:5-methylcytosine-specific restriction endonuclease McrA